MAKLEPKIETQLPTKMVSNSPYLPGWFIVSVVVTKETATGFNTQNKLYPIHAVSADESHGKAIALLAADFPEHRFHTVCSYPVNSLPNDMIEKTEERGY